MSSKSEPAQAASADQEAEIITPSQWLQKPKTDEDMIHDELGAYASTALAICEGLASEAKGLEEIAAAVTGKNREAAAKEFYRAKVRSAALSRTYARACATRAHVIAHGIVEAVKNEPCPHKARVIMQAKQWECARFNRADFGDEAPTTNVSVTNNVVAGDDVRAELMRRLDRKAKAITSSSSHGEKACLPPPPRGE